METYETQPAQMLWHRRWFNLAALFASWSHDPSTKCGAVIVRPSNFPQVAAFGYNDFPLHQGSWEQWNNRDEKYDRIVHAELNAILNLKEPITDAHTLYSWPPNVGPSCVRCAAHIAQAGIRRVAYVHDEQSPFAQRWADSAYKGLRILADCGVNVLAFSATDILNDPSK